MKIQFALSKIAQGVFNCDTAMEYLESKGLFVTEELYNDLKAAEQAHNDAKRWPMQDDIVGVKGVKGRWIDESDFDANFRGREGTNAIVVYNGMNLVVPFDRLFRL